MNSYSRWSMIYKELMPIIASPFEAIILEISNKPFPDPIALIRSAFY